MANGFARAGGEQAGYGKIAVKALDESIRAHGAYNELLRLNNASEVIWNKFVQICNNRGIGVNQKINEGVVKGFVELAQNSINLNPLKCIESRIVLNTIDAFLLLRRIRGIGDKIASFILRDAATILGVESRIAPQYQILLQPIDRWISGIATFLWNDLGERTPPWLIALRIIDKCREYGCSPARFNQGAWQYGSQIIQDTKEIPQRMTKLLS